MTTQSAAAKLTCDQAFFFRAKGKQKNASFSPRLQTKREEEPSNRRLLQNRVVQRRFNFRQFDSVRESKIKIKGTIFSFSTPTPTPTALHLQ